MCNNKHTQTLKDYKMPQLITVCHNNVKQLLLQKHVNLFNNCGAYATAKHLNNHGFAIHYALACLSVSKYKNNLQ